MPSLLNPYFEFPGNARQAMEFYKTVFGGKLDLQTFKENNMSHEPWQDNNIMHAMLVADNGITIMGADMMDPGEGRRVDRCDGRSIGGTHDGA